MPERGRVDGIIIFGVNFFSHWQFFKAAEGTMGAVKPMMIPVDIARLDSCIPKDFINKELMWGLGPADNRINILLYFNPSIRIPLQPYLTSTTLSFYFFFHSVLNVYYHLYYNIPLFPKDEQWTISGFLGAHHERDIYLNDKKNRNFIALFCYLFSEFRTVFWNLLLTFLIKTCH